jgi:hypothetical protein
MRTIEQAKHWIDEQRAKLGNPRITSVQAYLGDSMETVAIYAEVENQVEINGDLPLVAGFDLPAPITEKQFELMRETIEQQFASAYVHFTPERPTQPAGQSTNANVQFRLMSGVTK